ncbi:MAG TPA: ABC transporter permease subunit [Caldisericia bacterium]|nr:ABC transporter permease subunit [Caldisericia bacterium]HQG82169.1 ABC transporter permease subunit [Caldisericia bacterium]
MRLKFPFTKKNNIEPVDIFIVLIILSFIYGLIRAGAGIGKEISYSPQIFLTASNLPFYAWLSILRQLAAFAISVVFSIVYGYIASHYKKAEAIMIPLLDVMQSIPLLSFLPIFVISLITIFPNERLGLELACILLIFTSQVWNMAFSVYGSMKAIPKEYNEVANIFNFNKFLRFFYVELPASMIGFVWNSMMSVAGGWFFLMASEMFVLGGKDFRLPGIGSYLQLAAIEGNTQAILMGLGTIIIIIVLIDQLIWRPLIAWAQKFKTELKEEEVPTSTLLVQLNRSKIIKVISNSWNNMIDGITIKQLKKKDARPSLQTQKKQKFSFTSIIIYSLLILCVGYGSIMFFALTKNLKVDNWLNIVLADFFTLLRVVTAVFISLIWTVPLGVAIGLNKKLANKLEPIVQIFASIPATAVFPIIVMWLINSRGGINLASIVLMLLGTQWYILFNVIAGAQSIPTDLKEVSKIFKFRKLDKWRVLILPAIMPQLIIGLITATGGAWNASIVSEYVEFRGKIYNANGIGSLINIATSKGDYSLLAGSTLIMIITVVLINRYIWRKIYWKSIEHRV